MVFGQNGAMMDLEAFPEPLRPAVDRWWQEFRERHGEAAMNPTLEADISRTVAISEFCASVLLRDWKTLSLAEEFQLDGLVSACAALCDAGRDRSGAELRRLRRIAHCHLLFDELIGRVSTEQTLEKLSAVAEALIDSAISVAGAEIAVRHGDLRDVGGTPIRLLVLGMGKLGGRELNFSSDVDLIFVCPRDGVSDGDRELSALEYCTRWSRRVASLLDDVTAEGFVYRVDTRLRPFGKSGPPVASYASLETYLLNHGRAWERYAYLKARALGQSGRSSDADMLFRELITPFVYRGYLDFGLLDSLRDIHRRIDADKRGMQNNVKLGSGGIREIEFIVQSIQLLRGGVMHELKTQSLLQALRLLQDSQELPGDRARRLEYCYLYLRRLENYIQARRDQQTHELPAAEREQSALALAMGFAGWPELAEETRAIREEVAVLFADFAYREADEADELGALFRDQADRHAWQSALQSRGLRDGSLIADQLVGFRDACDHQNVSSDALERLQSLMPILVDALSGIADPDKGLRRLLRILDKVLRRSAYIALLTENAASLTRLLQLVSESKYISDQVALFPALLDELLDPQLFNKSFSRQELFARIQSRLQDIDSADAEARTERLARFQRHSLFQIAVCDVTDELTLMQTSDALTWLAESVLEAALQEARADVQSKFGNPGYVLGGTRHEAEFAIVAYGKLGGLELSYGSDLDLVFLHDSQGEEQVTDGRRSVDNSLFFARLVRRLLHILTTRTSSGVLYEIDTRLRPSGRSGLLVSGIDAFERYQRDDAWTWEHQSLLRARAVVGERGLRQSFERLRCKVLTEYTRQTSLLEDVRNMRRKMKAELDRSARDRFDLKQGDGGVADLEFIVQYLCLREARTHPRIIEFSDNIRQIEALTDCGILSAELGGELAKIYLSYRRAMHRRVLDAKNLLIPETDFRAERAAIVSAWETLLR